MLSPALVGCLGLLAMLIGLALGIHIGFVLGLLGFLGCVVLIGYAKSLSVLSATPYCTMADFSFVVLPMFILMGEFAFQGGLGELLYAAASKWLGRLHGGLAMATTAASAFFAVITGSSLATVASFGKVAVPEMIRLKYDAKLACGVVAASGSMASLIPPSGLMVFFCIFTQVSLGKLLLAGFIPGFLEALTYMVLIYFRVRLNPSLGPPLTEQVTWKEKALALRWLGPIVITAAVMLGGIYTGVFSPIEAGAIGAFVVFVVICSRRCLSLSLLKTSLSNTARTSAMIFFVVIGAMIFSKFLVLSNLPDMLLTVIAGLEVPPHVILIIVILVYIILGTFMDVIAMLAITLPMFFPLLNGLGFDGVWIGIIIVKVVEMAVITPPIGMNVFVAKAVVGDVVSLGGLFRGILPFFVMDIVSVILLVVFPQICLWLPSMMYT
jgi:C4-dicarboxylate transporter DctM subunit